MPADMNQPLEIIALTPDRLPDYLGFFDQDAFSDNPDWAGCYCHYPHADHRPDANPPWDQRTVAQNRAAAGQCIAEGRMSGFLARLDGRVVGWCNANRIDCYSVVAPDPELDAARTGFIACFVIAAPSRGQGIARRLLEAACESFRRRKFMVVEARPVRNAQGAAANYHGPLALYLENGFRIVREEKEALVVRRLLT